MADVADTRPWTIKTISLEARNAATSAADRDKMTIGAWLERAILSTIKIDRERGRAPSVIGPSSSTPPMADLSEVERVVEMLSKLAAAGVPAPKGAARLSAALVRSGVASMKAGLPLRQESLPLRQESPTLEDG
jgi:hypothetical protein